MLEKAKNSLLEKAKFTRDNASNILLIMRKTSLYILEFPCVGKGGNSVARSYATLFPYPSPTGTGLFENEVI